MGDFVGWPISLVVDLIRYFLFPSGNYIDIISHFGKSNEQRRAGHEELLRNQNGFHAT
jgi:hypothetical protein